MLEARFTDACQACPRPATVCWRRRAIKCYGNADLRLLSCASHYVVWPPRIHQDQRPALMPIAMANDPAVSGQPGLPGARAGSRLPA